VAEAVMARARSARLKSRKNRLIISPKRTAFFKGRMRNRWEETDQMASVAAAKKKGAKAATKEDGLESSLLRRGGNEGHKNSEPHIFSKRFIVLLFFIFFEIVGALHTSTSSLLVALDALGVVLVFLLLLALLGLPPGSGLAAVAVSVVVTAVLVVGLGGRFGRGLGREHGHHAPAGDDRFDGLPRLQEGQVLHHPRKDLREGVEGQKLMVVVRRRGRMGTSTFFFSSDLAMSSCVGKTTLKMMCKSPALGFGAEL
jgi:hypothetical protein